MVFYGVVMLIGVATVGLVGLVAPRNWFDGMGGPLIQGIAFMAAGFAINVVLVRQGWSTWSTLGWFPTGIGQDFGFGLVAGAIMGLGALGIAFAVGGADLYLTGESFGRYLGRALPVGIVIAIAALGEELVFRGYPLARLAKVLGRVGASLALGLVFTGVHIWNPEVSALGLANIALASLVLSAVFFGPGGLPAAWGLHFGWNGTMGVIFDAPVSGVEFGLPGVDFATGNPVWIGGGRFGPEGGVATTVVMVVALIWFARTARNRRERS